MKQHDIHNDDALYQQMLAELAPGAEEYNKIVACGKHPAAKKRRIIPYYKYVAAACVLFAVVGGTWYMLQERKDEPQPQQVAHIDDKKQEPTDIAVQLLAAEVQQQEEVPAPSSRRPKVHKRRKHVSRPRRATQSEQAAEESFDVSANMPDQELYLALLAEVEAREIQIEQQEQQSMRNLFDELIDNIEQQPNRPELIL